MLKTSPRPPRPDHVPTTYLSVHTASTLRQGGPRQVLLGRGGRSADVARCDGGITKRFISLNKHAVDITVPEFPTFVSKL